MRSKLTFLRVILPIDWDTLTLGDMMTLAAAPSLRHDFVGKTKYKNSQTPDSNRCSPILTFVDVKSLVDILVVGYPLLSLKIVRLLTKFVRNRSFDLDFVDRTDWWNFTWSEQTVCESIFKIVELRSYTYCKSIGYFLSLRACTDLDRNVEVQHLSSVDLT